MTLAEARVAGAGPIDPATGPQVVLEGRVVTMDDDRRVLDDGRVYVDRGSIVEVLPASAPVPPEFAAAPIVGTGGTIFPGLIELHNHLSYDILPLWTVPEPFTNRDQWAKRDDYRVAVTGPMSVLGKTSGYIEAIVRYVEAKCLVGGTTTSQGMTLQSNMGILRHYRGIVRNVEETGDPDLPDANTRVGDVEAGSAESFLERLQSSTSLLLHLSEGIDKTALSRFEALRIAPRQWAITDALAGIHCAALRKSDFALLGRRRAGMVWSPLSNLLLYRSTARIAQAKATKVTIALGSDWSPSGSKNLLAELKVASVLNRDLPDPFTSRELVEMVTVNPARILKWEGALGSLGRGKRADLVVVDGRQGDPYDQLLTAKETSLTLVMINGVARCGTPSLMERLGTVTETITLGDAERAINLLQPTGDDVVGGLTLQAATDTLRDGLARLPELARAREQPGFAATMTGITTAGRDGRWVLELDHNVDNPIAPGLLSSPDQVAAARPPLSEVLQPIELDALSLADDPGYVARLQGQSTLRPAFVDGLAELYA